MYNLWHRFVSFSNITIIHNFLFSTKNEIIYWFMHAFINADLKKMYARLILISALISAVIKISFQQTKNFSVM